MADAVTRIEITAKDSTAGAIQSAIENQKRLKKGVEDTTSGLSALGAEFTKLIGIVATFETVKFAARFADESAKAIVQLDILSKRAGTTVERFQTLSKVGDELGVGADEMARMLSKMNEAMALSVDSTGKEAYLLKFFGVNAKDATEATLQFLNGVSRLRTEQEKIAALTDMYGARQARDMLPLLDDIVRKYEDQLQVVRELGATPSDALIKKAKEYKQATQELELAWLGLKNEIMPSLLETMIKIMETAKNIVGYIKEAYRSLPAQTGSLSNLEQLALHGGPMGMAAPFQGGVMTEGWGGAQIKGPPEKTFTDFDKLKKAADASAESYKKLVAEGEKLEKELQRQMTAIQDADWKLYIDQVKEAADAIEKQASAAEQQAKALDAQTLELELGKNGALAYNVTIQETKALTAELTLEQSRLTSVLPEVRKRLEENAAAQRHLAESMKANLGANIGEDARKQAEASAHEAEMAFEHAAKEIDRDMAAMFSDLVFNGKNAFQNIADYAKRLFEKLILQPLLQPVANQAAGLFTGGGGGGLGGLGGGLGGLGDIFSSALGGTSMMGGSVLGSTIGMALPYVGAAVAIGVLVKSLIDSKKGGPKSGGYASIGDVGQLPSGAGPGGRYYTPSDADAQLKSLVDGINASYKDALKSFGGTGAAGFALGYDVDPKGSAGGRVSAGVQVGGKTVYNRLMGGLGNDDASIQAALTSASQHALLAALQQSELPTDIAAIIKSIDAATATDEAVANILDLAQSIKTLEDATVASITQLEAMKDVINQSGASLKQSMTLATLDSAGKYAFYQSDAAKLQQQLASAATPEATQALHDQILSDIQSAFGLLTPEQQTSMLSQFTAGVDKIDAEATARLTALEADIQKGADETAQKMKDAAATFAGAVDSFAAAAGTPVVVAVTPAAAPTTMLRRQTNFG